MATYANVVEFIRIESGFTEDELQKFLVSPEYVKYLKITNPTYLLRISPYNKRALQSFLRGNYKPYTNVVIRNLRKRENRNARYINYDEDAFDLFFEDDTELQLVQTFEDDYTKCLIQNYLCKLHNIDVGDIGVHDYRHFVLDCIVQRKECIHVVLCNYASTYYIFCQRHQLQKRAVISMIYEESNRELTENNMDRAFADEYIVSKILDFF